MTETDYMAEDATPVGWLTDVTLEGESHPRRVTFMRRTGRHLVVRQLDPAEPEPSRIPTFDGDVIEVATAISHVSLNTTAEPGDNTGFLLGLRLIETRRVGSKVYAKTLRIGDRDDGSRVHLGPGDELAIESLTVEFEHIDTLEEPTESGHIPLTPALVVWYSIGSHEPVRIRYLVAAARRLDAANIDSISARATLAQIHNEGLPGPQLRRAGLEILSRAELTVIALSRAIDMVTKAPQALATRVKIPAVIAEKATAVTQIRHAIEHIDERALGQVNKKTHAAALTLFDQRRLLEEGVIGYDDHELNLADDVPILIAAARQFILDVAIEAGDLEPRESSPIEGVRES